MNLLILLNLHSLQTQNQRKIIPFLRLNHLLFYPYYLSVKAYKCLKLTQIFIKNSGLSLGPNSKIADLPTKTFRKIAEVNITHQLMFAKIVLLYFIIDTFRFPVDFSIVGKIQLMKKQKIVST